MQVGFYGKAAINTLCTEGENVNNELFRGGDPSRARSEHWQTLINTFY